MVVGALIFVLGIDLVKEALWDTRARVNRYVCTIFSNGVCLTFRQVGVHHYREYHDIHDRLGLRHRCPVWYRHELYDYFARTAH